MFAQKLLRLARLPGAMALLAAFDIGASSAFVAQAAAQSPSTRQATPLSADDDPQAAAKADENDVPDPELIAITWQYRRQPDHKRLKQPVWTPDGARLGDAETTSLLDEVKNFQNHWSRPEELPPLVMVFRRSGAIKSGLSTAVVLADGRRVWGGTWGPFESNGLSKSACAPQLQDLAKWPEAVDLDVKVPLEDPQIIKTIDEVPDGSVEVGPGVRWYIDHDRGIDFKRGGEQRAHLTAAVLEIENDLPENLVFYEAKVWLRDQQQPLREAYGTIIGRQPGVFATLRVSKPLDDVNSIKSVDFTRQRFKIQRFKAVKLRVDLLLPPD